jgi:hypothetical protein
MWGRDHTVRLHVASPREAATPVGPDEIDVVIFDDSDQADALGYHDVDPHGHPYMRVFAAPVLDHGGGVLDGGRIGVSVASVASHEILETLIDPPANLWANAGQRLVAYEVGDPVQADGYSDGAVLLSNYVLRNWFTPGAPGPYDRMGLCRQPFEVRHGGYLIVATLTGEGTTNARTAPAADSVAIEQDTSPEWRQRSRRHEASRTMRRIRDVETRAV